MFDRKPNVPRRQPIRPERSCLARAEQHSRAAREASARARNALSPRQPQFAARHPQVGQRDKVMSCAVYCRTCLPGRTERSASPDRLTAPRGSSRPQLAGGCACHESSSRRAWSVCFIHYVQSLPIPIPIGGRRRDGLNTMLHWPTALASRRVP